MGIEYVKVNDDTLKIIETAPQETVYKVSDLLYMESEVTQLINELEITTNTKKQTLEAQLQNIRDLIAKAVQVGIEVEND